MCDKCDNVCGSEKMSRNELIEAINNMFDENVELQYKLEKTKVVNILNKRNKVVEKNCDNQESIIHEIVYGLGIDKIFQDVMVYWESDRGIRKLSDSKGPEPFEQWVDHWIDEKKIPKNLSYDDVLYLLENKLHEEYKEQLKKFNKEGKETNE